MSRERDVGLLKSRSRAIVTEGSGDNKSLIISISAQGLSAQAARICASGSVVQEKKGQGGPHLAD